jgi:hypothetical protein
MLLFHLAILFGTVSSDGVDLVW